MDNLATVGNSDKYSASMRSARARYYKDYRDECQKAVHIKADGYAGAKTLSKLDQLSPDSATERFGRELTHSQITADYSSSNMSATEALARCIYGEDTTYAEGQSAVAKEIYNRKNSSRPFDTKTGSGKTWKGIVFSKSQYAVMTGGSSDTSNSRKPNQYSSEWAKCVTLAETLIGGKKPNSALNNQCYHLSSGSSYPSNSVASTRVQIPSGKGNKFFDYQTSL